MDMSDVTAGWTLVSIGTESQATWIGGVDAWKAEWRRLSGAFIVVPHPQYPLQRHRMDLYELDSAERVVRFAAGEFSNGIWGFYVPDRDTRGAQPAPDAVDG